MKTYLKFKEEKDTGKTKVFGVFNLTGERLAQIGWFPGWRRYTLTAKRNTIWDSSCLKEITTFIDNLMEERKNRS